MPDDSDGKGDSPHAGDSGILNGDGGVPAGPSCFDGIQNQDETSFDCGGVCGDCEPGTFSLSLADFMQSKFDITVNGERYTNENSLSPVYTENYLYCDWSAPDASTCRAQTLAACPNLQPNQWGCLLKGRANVEGAGWKYGFYTRPERPNFRYLSKGGFPPSTLEVFWFDSAWVYAFSSTLGLPNKFMSYQQPPHASVTYPYRGGVWYRNAFTVNKASGLPGVWVGPTILAPDNDVLEFNDNRWTKTTVWGPGTPGSEGYLVSRYYPRMVNFSNEDGGMLPKAMNVLAIESGRRDVGHPEIVRFQETYFYAAYGPQRFGLIRFELWASEPAVCLDNAGRYPDAICNGHMVRSGVTSPNRFTHLPEYDQAPYANTKAFFTDAFAQKPKNDPKPKRRDPWTSNAPQVRGGFRYPGPGSDVTGEAVGVNEWVYLEHNLFDADWHFLKSTDWKCSEGYKYLGSIAVNGSMDRNKGVTEGAHWIILCGTDDDLRLETTCPSGFETRGWFRADLGGRTSSGVDVPAGATFMNWCVRQSECVGACWPSSVP